ncbi:hypothetical protein [Larkinella rosea]|uniref:ZU5 domain-containing protein n=1 Tax=Larkinella rosea TaxID=2025312 RepID=A0A3P1BVL0_9BACT|nr:hypothetical protein [Larkinella rosea]RRB04644.1 hypothetical protein EHT25_14315 [Larkinella rosea]
MKLTHYIATGLAMIGSLMACEPKPEVTPEKPGLPQQETGSGTVTEIGQPLGGLVSKTIGPEGGTIATADGKVQLVLPAGALGKATNITIQPITNTAPNGIGPAFRFSPDGLQFAKPATLTFAYTDERVTANDADMLKVAFQSENKIWQNVTGVTVDTQTKRISAPMAHFSDWSAYEIAYLESFVVYSGGRTQTEFVQYGETISLGIYEDLIIDDAVQKVADEKFGDIKDVKWSLAGAGEIKKSQSAKGIFYVAPKTGKDRIRVTISAEITFRKSPKKLILFHPIYVGNNYVEVNFDGNPTRVYTRVGLVSSSGQVWYIEAGDREDDYLSLAVFGNTAGKFPFGNALKTESGISSGYYNQGNYAYRTHFACVADIDRGVQIMEGSVVVEEYVKGKVARGTFSGTLMKDDPEQDCPSHKVPISGKFFLTPE